MAPRRRDSLQNWFVSLVTALLAVVTVVAPSLAVAGVAGLPTGPVAGATTVSSAPDAPSFLQYNLTEARGDVVTVVIDASNATNATLRVGPGGDRASNVAAEIALLDANADGRIEVRLNTYTLGTGDDAAVTARGEDAADVRRSSSLDEPLRTGNYSLTLLVGNETVDESTLVLRPAGVEALRLQVANGSRPASLSSRAGIVSAVENGTFRRNDRMPLSAVVLLELEASGLSGALASRSAPNDTARFLALLDAPGFSLTVRENVSSLTSHDKGVAFSLAPDATTVVANPRNDTYYVLVGLAGLPHESIGGEEEPRRVEIGDVIDFNFTVTPATGTFESRQSVVSQVRVFGRATVDSPIEAASGPGQTVRATTTLPEGTAVGVRLVDEDSPYGSTRTVAVGESGRIVATFDFTNLSVGDRLHLYVQLGDADDPLVLYFERNAVWVTERGTPTTTATTTMSPGVPTRTATSATPTGDSPDPIPGFGAVTALLASAAAMAIAAYRRSQ